MKHLWKINRSSVEFSKTKSTTIRKFQGELLYLVKKVWNCLSKDVTCPFARLIHCKVQNHISNTKNWKDQPIFKPLGLNEKPFWSKTFLPPGSCVGWTYQRCGAARDMSVCLQRPWFPDSWKDQAASSGIHSRPLESQPAGEGKRQEVTSGRFPPQQSPGHGRDTFDLIVFIMLVTLTLPSFLLIISNYP